MTLPSPPSPDRLAIHSWTTRPLSLPECINAYRAAGIPGISVWREHIAPIGIARAASLLRESGLRVPALVRAGFFVHPDPARRAAALEDCRRAVADAAALGADMLVIVPGAHPRVPLAEGRALVRDAIAQTLDTAAAHDVRLALEPLHPMYAADRSCISTLSQAIELTTALDHPLLGVALDVFHVWWDPDLRSGIQELGRLQRLFAFHVCDWKTDMRDPLNDRGCMGDGCIPIRMIRSWVEDAGFSGMIEVEVFSEHYWSQDQHRYLEHIKQAYRQHV